MGIEQNKPMMEHGDYLEEYNRLRQELFEKASKLVLYQRAHVMTSGSADEHAEVLKALEQIFPQA